MFFRIARYIIPVVIPYQDIGGRDIILAVMLEDFFLVWSVIPVMESDLFPVPDGSVNGINVYEDIRIGSLQAVTCIDPCHQVLSVLLVCQLRQFADQQFAFFCCDKPGRGNRVNQQFQFR